MASQALCDCGWKPRRPGNSTRALTAHLRVCPLREAKVADSQLKRRATDITPGDAGDGLTPIEPARKTPRHSVRWNKTLGVDTVLKRKAPVVGRALTGEVCHGVR